jgi:hypothetical protein
VIFTSEKTTAAAVVRSARGNARRARHATSIRVSPPHAPRDIAASRLTASSVPRSALADHLPSPCRSTRVGTSASSRTS